MENKKTLWQTEREEPASPHSVPISIISATLGGIPNLRKARKLVSPRLQSTKSQKWQFHLYRVCQHHYQCTQHEGGEEFGIREAHKND
ncbi:Cyclin-G-Associated Kinase [Manis pentadactyla]|nr:Cyclin-G-Associated Kinase [Manis pentadactyla]